MKSKFPYILAVVFGLVIPILMQMKPVLVIIGFLYFICGSFFGFFWPKESWRWGLWMVGPVFFLLGLSVLFAGQFQAFVKNDLPILLVALAAGCLGGFLLAKYKNKTPKKI